MNLDLIPWEWIAGLGLTGAVAVGVAVWWFTGSWRAAVAAAGSFAMAILYASVKQKGREEGRMAERKRNEKAAQKRATKRKERLDEIQNLDDNALARRAGRWVREPKGGKRT